MGSRGSSEAMISVGTGFRLRFSQKKLHNVAKLKCIHPLLSESSKGISEQVVDSDEQTSNSDDLWEHDE